MASAYAHVTRTSGTNPFVSYAVVNDGGFPNQRSDDGAFVAMEAEESTSAPRLETGATSLDFGTVTPGQTRDLTLTVRNAGGGTLTGSASAASPFAVVSGGSFTLAASQSQSIAVRFSPSTAGATSGTLQLSSNGGSAVVALTGTGAAAATPRIEVTPASVPYGSVPIGSSKDLDLTVRNTGTASLTVSGAATLAPFTVITAVPFGLASGASKAVTVRFTPTSTGTVTATLSFVSNDPLSPTTVVQLTGTGSATEELLTDDGTVETGVIQGGLTVVNRLTPTRYPATLRTIRIFFQQFQNLPTPACAQIRLVVFTDPSGTGRPPSGATVLMSGFLTIPSLPTAGAFVDYAIDGGPSVPSGDLYVGFLAPNPPGGVVFTADTNGTQRSRGWYSADGGTTFQGPLGVQNQQGGVTPVNILIRASVSIPGSRPEDELVVGKRTPAVHLTPVMKSRE